MNWELFTRILKDKKVSLLAYTLGAVATVEMYIALFPALKKQSEQLNQLLAAYPKGFLEAFGFNGTVALFSKVESYMSTEYFTFFWPIMVVTLVVAFANLMIVAEIEKGTIELTLSQPISRIHLFLIRYFAGVTYLTLFTVVSVFSIIPISKLNNVRYAWASYPKTFGISLLFGLAIFSMATFFSAVFSEKGRATACSAALLIVMYLMNIVGTLKESLHIVQKFSVFYYFNPATVFGNNEIVQYSIPVFLGIIIVFTGLAAFWFNRRDVAV